MGNTEQTQKKLLLRFSASLTHLNMKSSAPVRRYKDPQLKSHVVCLCRVFHLWKNKRSNKILFALGFYSVQCDVCHHDCLQVRVTTGLCKTFCIYRSIWFMYWFLLIPILRMQQAVTLHINKANYSRIMINIIRFLNSMLNMLIKIWL